MNQKELFKFWQKKEVQLFIDMCRIALIIIAIIILVILISEIEAVKLLNSNPCLICVNKTGCSCFCPQIP